MIDNHVSIIGRVYEKELRYTTGGNAVMNLRVGVKDNSKVPLAILDVVMWGKLAEQAQTVMTDKCRVLIEGAIRQDRWETSEGKKRTKLFIKSNRFVLLDMSFFDKISKDDGQNQDDRPTRTTQKPASRPVVEEEGADDVENEIPF